MRVNNGTVTGLSKQTIPSGKTVHIMHVEGNEYNVGFYPAKDTKTKRPIRPGDIVSFDYEFKYGANQADYKTIVAGYDKSAGASSPADVLKNASNQQQSFGGGGGRYAAKVFPVPLDHGDRSIIRQNSLTNARELYVGTIPHGEIVSLDDAVDAILDIAAKFEKYSAGDYEREAAELMKEVSNDNG